MDFVMVANAWQAGIANPTSKHRIALELAARGHRVLWVEGSGMRRPSLGSGADRSRMAGKVRAALRGVRRAELPAGAAPAGGGGIWVWSPLLLPLPSRAWARGLNGALCAWGARLGAWRLGFRQPVLINYVPVLAGAMRAWPGRRVYHCVDRWDAFDMYDAAIMARMDERCCRAAGLVIASSRDLETRCRRFTDRVVMIPHGVDHGHFARALMVAERPADLRAGPLVGFFGLISEWLDQDLLIGLARALPDANVVLIGASDVDDSRLRAEPRIAVLGPRPFARLPEYASAFTVGLIPFVVNDLTRAVNPIKLREMLAAGCPVVSTALPEVEEVATAANRAVGFEGVRVERTPEAFVAAVAGFVKAPLAAVQRGALSGAMAAETWTGKVGLILDAIERVEGAG